MKTIGITGGIGAGKSEIINFIRTVSKSRIILADEVAHNLEKKGMPAYWELIDLLTEKILMEDGEIDKAKMAAAIFSDASGDILLRVNNIVHPKVKQYILDAILEEKKKGEIDFLFIEAALLIEEGYDRICDELWYIYASEAVRRSRLKAARGYSDEKIDSIFSKQNSEETFRKYCRVEINNDGSLERAYNDVRKYLEK